MPRVAGDDERIGRPKTSGKLVIGCYHFASLDFGQGEVDAVVDGLFLGNGDVQCPNQQRRGVPDFERAGGVKESPERDVGD